MDLRVNLTDDFYARVRLMLPPDFDENSVYPAVVNVQVSLKKFHLIVNDIIFGRYGGPNSNQISDSYSSGVMNYFVTNRTYIYIYIDGRGSGKDGQNKMFQIYRSLGTIEIEDQIYVTKYS